MHEQTVASVKERRQTGIESRGLRRHPTVFHADLGALSSHEPRLLLRAARFEAGFLFL